MDTIGMKTCLNTVVHCYSVKLNERLLWFKANFILINILHVQNKVYLLGQCLDWTGLTQSKRILHQFGQGCETVFGSENMTLVPFVHESDAIFASPDRVRWLLGVVIHKKQKSSLSELGAYIEAS